MIGLFGFVLTFDVRDECGSVCGFCVFTVSALIVPRFLPGRFGVRPGGSLSSPTRELRAPSLGMALTENEDWEVKKEVKPCLKLLNFLNDVCLFRVVFV